MGCSCAKAGSVEEASLRPQGAPAPRPVPTSVIGKKVAQAKTTRILALRECGLKALPADAVGSEFAALRTADLTANQLKVLPDAIGSWTGLQNLNCGQNKLTELPKSIGLLASLQKLVLSDNRLQTLPLELAQLGKLKVLQLNGNSLGEGLARGALPADAFSGPLAGSLEELDLSSNSFSELPRCVANLSVLQRLLVARNQCSSLPEELSQLTKLQYLDASENKMVTLPARMLVGMTSLSELWLKGNPMDRLQLQELPGFSDFLARRRDRLDAKIEANVVGRVNLSVCGLE